MVLDARGRAVRLRIFSSLVLLGFLVAAPYTVLAQSAPQITSLSPAQGRTGDSIRIVGTNFGSSQGNGQVRFYNFAAQIWQGQWPVTSWSDTEIVLTVPPLAVSGNLDVVVASQEISNSAWVTVLPPLDAGYGPIEGRVLDAAGNPFGNARVAVRGPNLNSVPDVMTDVNGRYAFNNVAPGPFWVQASSDGLHYVTQSGNLQNVSNTAEVDLQFPGTGTVQGTITYPDGTPAAYVYPQIQNLSSLGPLGTYYDWDLLTDSAGHYSAPGVPGGDLYISASDDVDNNNAVLAQVHLNAGEVKTVDLTIDRRAFSFDDPGLTPDNLDGTDGFRYDVNCAGNLNGGGTPDGSVFRPFDNWQGVGGEYLSINGTESTTAFPCVQAAWVDASGRQLTSGAVNLDGIQVTRKIFVPNSGGFARYLEILRNPGSLAANIDVILRSSLGSGQFSHLDVAPSETGNTYAVMDTGVPVSFGATIADVFAGNGTNGPNGSHFVSGDGLTSFHWNVTVPAGGSVALMHFVVQRAETDLASARAQAEALRDLTDPNALTNLTSADQAMVANFASGPQITSVSPSAGPAGAQVTITGGGFGATQGTGNVWLGSTYGQVVSWSDTQVVASVASGARPGVARILQGGVWSNAINFNVPSASGYLASRFEITRFSEPPQYQPINLSDPEIIDWVQYGLHNAATVNRKAGSNLIGDLSYLLPSNSYQPYSCFTHFAWTNGTADPSLNDACSQLVAYYVGNGFRLTVPADTTARTLKLYVGLEGATGKLDAQLSDNSAAAVSDSSFITEEDAAGTYTIDFKAASPGQTLTVTYSDVDQLWWGGHLTIEAAVLTPKYPDVAITQPSPGESFSSQATFTVHAEASQIDAPISNVSISQDGNSAANVTTPPYEFQASSLPGGNYSFAATATDSAGLSQTSAPVPVHVVGSGGGLAASVAASPNDIDLTQEGSADWVLLGRVDETQIDRKADVVPLIGAISAVNWAHWYTFNFGPVTFSATDSTADCCSTHSGVYSPNLASGFEFSVAAGIMERTVHVYAGASGARGKLEAYLSDGSAPVYVDTSIDAPDDTQERVYTIRFHAASENQS